MRWLCTEQILGPGGYGIENCQVMDSDYFAHPNKKHLPEIDKDASGPFLQLDICASSTMLEDLLRGCQDEIRKRPHIGDYLNKNLATILTGQDEKWGLAGVEFDTKETGFVFITARTSDDGERHIDDRMLVVLGNDDLYHEFFVNVPGWDGTVSERYQVITEDNNVHINEYRNGKIISYAELYLEEIGDKKVEKIRIWEYRR